MLNKKKEIDLYHLFKMLFLEKDIKELEKFLSKSNDLTQDNKLKNKTANN